MRRKNMIPQKTIVTTNAIALTTERKVKPLERDLTKSIDN
jgi:hypothetical protein